MSFKQIIKILLITLLISSAVSAKLGFNLGARGGLSSSWLIGDEFDYWYKDIQGADSYENMKSFSAALIAEFEILPLLSAQTEIGYIRKGITLLQSETNAKVDNLIISNGQFWRNLHLVVLEFSAPLFMLDLRFAS